MKITEYENEQALELIADLLEPMTVILGDKEMPRLFASESKIALVKYVIKNYKSEIIDILAIIDGVPREEYKCNVFTLPKKILELLEDSETINFFTQSALTNQPFGGAMGTTAEAVEE